MRFRERQRALALAGAVLLAGVGVALAVEFSYRPSDRCEYQMLDTDEVAAVVGRGYAGIDPRRSYEIQVLSVNPVSPAGERRIASLAGCPVRTVAANYPLTELEGFANRVAFELRKSSTIGHYWSVAVVEAQNKVVVETASDSFATSDVNRILDQVPDDAVVLRTGVEPQTTGPR